MENPESNSTQNSEQTPTNVIDTESQPISQVSADKQNRKSTKKIVLLAVLIVGALMATVYFVLFFNKKEGSNQNQEDTTNISTNDSAIKPDDDREQISCLSFKKLQPETDRGLSIKVTDTSSTGKTCKFIVQYEGLGDAPIAVGEVFVGDGTEDWQQKKDFVSKGLADGYEPDLIDLGLMRTGKSKTMEILDQNELIVDGTNAAIFYHRSYRSISSEAYSVVVETPSGLSLSSEPTSSLLIWGAANQANKGLMKQLVESIKWKD